MRFRPGLTCLTLLLAQGCYLDWPDRLLRRDSQVTDGSELDLPVKDGAPGSDADGLSPCFGQICPTGCNVQEKRCYRLKPSNIDPAGFFGLATGALALTTTDATIDTGTGEIKQGTTVIRPAGSKGSAANGVYWDVVSQGAGAPEVAVFAAASLDLAASAQVTVVGQHALALYLIDSASVAGTLQAPAKGSTGSRRRSGGWSKPSPPSVASSVQSSWWSTVTPEATGSAASLPGSPSPWPSSPRSSPWCSPSSWPWGPGASHNARC